MKHVIEGDDSGTHTPADTIAHVSDWAIAEDKSVCFFTIVDEDNRSHKFACEKDNLLKLANFLNEMVLRVQFGTVSGLVPEAIPVQTSNMLLMVDAANNQSVLRIRTLSGPEIITTAGPQLTEQLAAGFASASRELKKDRRK